MFVVCKSVENNVFGVENTNRKKGISKYFQKVTESKILTLGSNNFLFWIFFHPKMINMASYAIKKLRTYAVDPRGRRSQKLLSFCQVSFWSVLKKLSKSYKNTKAGVSHPLSILTHFLLGSTRMRKLSPEHVWSSKLVIPVSSHRKSYLSVFKKLVY